MNKVNELKKDCLSADGVISKIKVDLNSIPNFDKKNDNVLGR